MPVSKAAQVEPRSKSTSLSRRPSLTPPPSGGRGGGGGSSRSGSAQRRGSFGSGSVERKLPGIQGRAQRTVGRTRCGSNLMRCSPPTSHTTTHPMHDSSSQRPKIVIPIRLRRLPRARRSRPRKIPIRLVPRRLRLPQRARAAEARGGGAVSGKREMRRSGPRSLLVAHLTRAAAGKMVEEFPGTSDPECRRPPQQPASAKPIRSARPPTAPGGRGCVEHRQVMTKASPRAHAR